MNQRQAGDSTQKIRLSSNVEEELLIKGKGTGEINKSMINRKARTTEGVEGQEVEYQNMSRDPEIKLDTND